jgi:iron(III) transport system substrate-binding protein
VIYVEAPRSIAGPILKSFSEQTGLEVHPVYGENAGTAFLLRVAEEAAAGRADLFWAATPLAAIDLARRGLAVPFRPVAARTVPSQYLDPGFRWIGFAVNPRVIIYNSNLVKREEAPQSINDLVQPPWGGKGVLARIRDGTSAFAAAAVFTVRGPESARSFFDQVLARGNRVVLDEEEVARQVASGGRQWGVTDLDVAIRANREGAPLHITYPRLTLEAFMIPQVAVLLPHAPHPEQAKSLLAYLLTTETAYEIGRNDRALITLRSGVPKPDWLPPLGAFNVTRLDNEAIFDAFKKHSAYFTAWGGGDAGSPRPPEP